MAFLSPPAARVETTAGAPISGGKLRVYQANTTTPASLYSDVGMTTPLTNPVVADSNGMLPAIFAAEGVYDIAYMTAGGVLIAGMAYDDFPTFQGAVSNAIQVTMSGARFKAYGGDIGDGTIGVNIEAGPPSPVDTGGIMRIGGWAGTQASRIDVDAAYIDVLQVGGLRENGKKITEVIDNTYSVSGASTLIIALTDSPTNCRVWDIDLIDFWGTGTAASMYAQFSFDNGSTYKSGASDYKTFSGVPGSLAAASQAWFVITGWPANSSTKPNTGRIRITTPISTSLPNAGQLTTFVSRSDYWPSTDNTYFECTGYCTGNYGKATHIKFTCTPGNMSGRVRVRPQRGFGE